MNIAAESGHLGLLQRTDLTIGIEDHHPDIIHAIEAMRHRTSCIPGSRCKNSNRLSVTKITEHSTHEAGPEILECESRSVEQFKIIQSIRYGIQLHRKIICITHKPVHILVRDIIKHGLSKINSHICIGFFCKRHNLVHIDMRYGFRYEKPSVRGKAGKSGILQREGALMSLVACTIIYHDSFCLNIPRFCSGRQYYLEESDELRTRAPSLETVPT